jgi:GTP-binding protein
LIADVGLVGLPNAGKSTLLSQLSAANPKVAAYPFTTLEPQLGVLQFKYNDPCIIADIPGLVEGAHNGVGLGHKFLRHIERTSIILHVIDAADENVKENYSIIANELLSYKEELADRTQILVLNKIDLIDESLVKELEEFFIAYSRDVVSISGLTGLGIEHLKEKIADKLDENQL